MPNILVLGTCDTKLPELLYLREEILRHPDTSVTLIDVGREHVDHPAITIPQSELVQKYGRNAPIAELSRGELNRHMATCAKDAVKALVYQPTGRIGAPHGIVSLGGSGGTSLAAAVMREALPLGFPKLIVSTIASGDTGSIVGEADITLMYSVVDVAGLNELLQKVLTNAAGAMVGMAGAYQRKLQEKKETNGEGSGSKRKVRVGITMFGVTTPCVDAMRAHLTASKEADFEVFVFHATGHGGRAMERLIEEGGLDAIIDLTTTEICDHLCGGNMSAGPRRLEAAIKAEIPCVVSVGATDMVNFGPRDTVPERYRNRKLYEHNPSVTLMRTRADEARAVGTFIADKLKMHKRAGGLVEVWLPNGGVSMISEPGGPFESREADAALFTAVEQGLQGAPIRVVSDERAINDSSFAVDVAEALVRMVRTGKEPNCQARAHV